MSDYERITKAIRYISAHAGDQPSLDAIAAHVHLSPFHFQRMFGRWAGVTPKRFLQTLSAERAKERLDRSESVFDSSLAVGLSSGSRRHDHFVQLEGRQLLRIALPAQEIHQREALVTTEGLSLHCGIRSNRKSRKASRKRHQPTRCQRHP